MTDKQDIHAELMARVDWYADTSRGEIRNVRRSVLCDFSCRLTDRLEQAEQEIVALTLSVSNRDARISEMEAQPAPAVVEPDDLQDAISKALRRAWQLGQTYWQQADSEYVSQHKKSAETQRKFEQLVDESRALITAPQPHQIAEPATRVMFHEGSPEVKTSNLINCDLPCGTLLYLAQQADAELVNAVNALLHQIDIGDFADSNGHSAKMLKPVHGLMKLLGATPKEPS